MSVSGYLVPFPDHGAADLMSNHLEQVVQTTGPGKIFTRTTSPANPSNGPENPSGSDSRSTRMKLEFFRLKENEWVLLHDTTVEGGQESEEVVLDVQSAESIKCTLTNMSGREGQFFLDCTYEPADQK
jgi:hypothetical protein